MCHLKMTVAVFPSVATAHAYCLLNTLLLPKHVASLCDLNNSHVHFYVTEMCRKNETWLVVQIPLEVCLVTTMHFTYYKYELSL